MKIKSLYKRIRAYLPSRLPTGIVEFNAWVDDIIKFSGLPDNDTVRGSVALMVIHLPEAAGYRSKEFFIRCLIKSASSQVCHQVFIEAKSRHEAAAKAELEAASNVTSISPV